MNNFDTSTTCICLELSCFYDTDVSQSDFDENFIRIDGLNGASLLNDRFSRVSIFSYTQCGEYAEIDPADLANYSNVTIKAVRELLLSSVYGSLEEATERSKYVCEQYFSKLSKSQFIDLLNEEMKSNFSDSEIARFYRDTFTPSYMIVSIRGYSQGDYAEIIYDPKCNYDGLHDYFTNLFYDAPIYARLTIDDEDVNLDEALNDRYYWDRDQVLTYAKDHIKNEYVIAWLCENLPDQLEYLN